MTRSCLPFLTGAAVTVAALALAAPAAHAQSTVTLSPDITVDLGGTVYADEDAANDDQLGTITPASLGTLPDNVDVTGYEVLANGDRLFAIDITADLGGGVTLGPDDVGRYNGSVYSVEFDGGAANVPNGSHVDAVTVNAAGNLLLSFDTTVDLGGGVVAADEDLVEWNGSSFSSYFDGSADGIPEELDLDGASLDVDSGRLAVSLDGSGTTTGASVVSFDDEDVLEFQPVGSTWTLVYDGATLHADLGPADVNAVPEPQVLLQLAAGAAGLALLARRRRRWSGA